MPSPSIVSRLIKPTDAERLNPPSYHVVIPLTHVDDASLLIAHNFDIVSLLVPHTWYLKRLLAALDAVSVNAILIRLGVPVVFQVSVIANVVCAFVPVSECVDVKAVPFAIFIIHCVPVKLPDATVIPAFAVYNQDDDIVPVANVDDDKVPHHESVGFNCAQNQGNDEDLKYQESSV